MGRVGVMTFGGMVHMTGPRLLCAACGRVRPARARAEYTAARADLLIAKGLCTCPPDAGPVRRGAEVAGRAR